MSTGTKPKCKDCEFLDVQTKLDGKVADIVFITQQKLENDFQSAVILQILNTIKTDKRFKQPEIWITPLWKCPREGKMTKTKLKKCLPILKKEIAFLSPQYIMCFGLDVTSVVLGSKSFSVLTPIYVTEYDAVMIPMLDINVYMENKDLLSEHMNLLSEALTMEIKKTLKTQILLETDHILEFIEFLKTQEVVGFDIETNSLDPFSENSDILSVSFGVDNIGIGFPLHLKFQGHYLCDSDMVQNALKELFSQKTPVLVGHNMMFDIKFIESKFDIEVKNRFIDTMILAYINDENAHSLKLEALLPEIGLPNHKTYDFSPQDYKDGNLLNAMDVTDLLTYNAKDAISTLLLSKYLITKLPEASNPLVRLLHDTARVLIDIDRTGMPVDLKRAQEVSNTLTQEIKKIEEEILSIPEVKDVMKEKELITLNISSPQQIVAVLEKLKAPVISTTKSGKMSTSADNLQILAEEYDVEFAKKVLDYRTKTKLLTTYLTPLLSEEGDLVKADGRVHPSFGLTTTRTGRLSCSKPNLQNIPRDKTIKQIFVPNPGELMVNFDYSQAELRVLAMLSKDSTLMRAYKEGQDIHRITASSVYKVSLEEVTDEQRQNAKTINFAILYGISAQGLAKSLRITDKEAETIIKRWFETFPGARRFTEKIKVIAENTGQIATPFGRIRHIPAIRSSDRKEKAHAIRQAVNFPTQSTASDLLLLSIIKIHKLLKNNNYKSAILTTVHDSISISMARNEVDVLIPRIVDILEEHNFPWMQGIKMEAEVSVGTTLATDAVIERDQLDKVSQHEYWEQVQTV